MQGLAYPFGSPISFSFRMPSGGFVPRGASLNVELLRRLGDSEPLAEFHGEAAGDSAVLTATTADEIPIGDYVCHANVTLKNGTVLTTSARVSVVDPLVFAPTAKA